MKISDTISVNPGKETLGHVENPSTSIFRNPVIGAESRTRSIDIVKMIFPSALSGSSEFRKYDVPLRTLFSTILIVTGITMLNVPSGIHGNGFAISTICFGALLAIGLFTRPLMLGSAIFYCISGALSLRTGIADMTTFSLMFGCLIFAVIGSGKYSCDSFIRNSIKTHKRKIERKRKENMMGYKAFHQVKF